MMKKNLLIYERFKLLSGKNFFLNWSLIYLIWSLVYFSFQAIFKNIDKINIHILILSLIFLLTPVEMVNFQYKYHSRLWNARRIFWKNDKEAQRWINRSFENIFTFSKQKSKMITIFLAIFLIMILGNVYNLPLRLHLPFILELIWIIPVSFIVGHAVYICISTLSSLDGLIKLDIASIKEGLPNFHIERLMNLFMIVCPINELIIYFLLINPVIFKPVSLESISIESFIFTFSILPFIWLVISIYCFHRIMKNIRNMFLIKIDHSIYQAIKNVDKCYECEDLQKIEKLFDIKSEILKIKIWPLSLNTVASAIITLLPIATQIISLFGIEIN